MKKLIKKRVRRGTSLVAQWLGIRLPVQGTWVRALVRGDPTCRKAAKPLRHNCWACTLEPMSHNYWARVPHLLKPVHLEPVLHNRRGHCSEKPVHRNQDPMQPKINKFFFFKKRVRWKWYMLIVNILTKNRQRNHLCQWMNVGPSKTHSLNMGPRVRVQCDLSHLEMWCPFSTSLVISTYLCL